MAIKKLQNDLTTPEQAKRLLELGVPEDSANFVIVTETHCMRHLNIRYSDYVPKGYEKYYIPCWSVGRLIEIMTICYKWDLLSCASFRIYMTDIISCNLINRLINDLSLEISRGKIDFSKLEE